jgi:uncharacterized protein (DUF2384 family)
MAGLQQIGTKPIPAGMMPPASPESVQDMTRYRALIARAVDVFGDEIKASKWLSLPNRDLAGKTPLQVAQSNGYDPEVLEPIFIRIEHGVDD